MGGEKLIELLLADPIAEAGRAERGAESNAGTAIGEPADGGVLENEVEVAELAER